MSAIDTTISTADTSTLAVDTSGMRQHFVEDTRQKFADAGYNLSIDEVDILVTKLPCSLYETLFDRVLQPMHGAGARPAPRTNEIYIDQAKKIAELEAERDKWEWVARHADRPSLMDRPNLCERNAAAILFILNHWNKRQERGR